MNQQLAALSTDLRRISYWLYRDQVKLAHQFLHSSQKTSLDINCSLGKSDLQTQLSILNSDQEDRLHAAERALTTSLLLLHQAKRLP